MRQIQLNDQIYEQAERRASEAGFTSVDEYVADVVQQNLVEETENFDHLFTPQRLAEIEQAAADVDAGNYYTAEQVREHFRKKRDA